MKLYAMICGHMRARQKIFLPDTESDVFAESPIPVFLITHPQGNVLFDTGPHPDAFKDAASRWGGLAKAFKPIGDKNCSVLAQLKKIGFGSEKIKYVVNSHLHFDHAGGNQFFSKSTFLVSKKELECAKTPENEGKGYFRADWEHPLTYRKIDGEMDLFDDGKLRIMPMPGHTPGHQILAVRLEAEGTVVLSGDGAAFKEHYYDFVAPRNNMDSKQAIQSIKDLHSMVEKEKAFPIHGHDPSQWKEIKIAPGYYD